MENMHFWSRHPPTCSHWLVLGSPGAAVQLHAPQFPYRPHGCVWVPLNSSSSQASQMMDLVITILHPLTPRTGVVLQSIDGRDCLQLL